MLLWNGAVSVRVEDGHWRTTWWFFHSTRLSTLPLNMCQACRVCSLFSVTPLGAGSLGFKGLPSAAFQSNSLYIILTLVWASGRRRSQRWQKYKRRVKDGEIVYFMFTFAHLTIQEFVWLLGLCISFSFQLIWKFEHFIARFSGRTTFQ